MAIPKRVGCALEEGNVVGAELVLGPAVDLQHPERPALSLQDKGSWRGECHTAPVSSGVRESLFGSQADWL